MLKTNMKNILVRNLDHESMKKKKKESIKNLLAVGDMVVYPSHGVGQISKIEKIEVGGIKCKCLKIVMEQDQLIVKVPFEKIVEVGLRKLASKNLMQKALNQLKGRPKVRRMMWSRKAQEYNQKINSGSPMLVSEVVRDLFRKNNQPEQSYSERQMFQAAVERLARELAAIDNTDHFSATEKIESILESK